MVRLSAFSARVKVSCIVLLILTFTLSFITGSHALLTASLTARDIARITSDLTLTQPNADSLAAVIQTLKLINAPITNSSLYAKLISGSIADTSSITSLSQSVLAATTLGQPTLSLTAAQQTLIKTALASTNIIALSNAVSALSALSAAKSVKFSDYDASTVAATLSELNELDHTYRQSRSADEGTLYHTGLAYNIIAALQANSKSGAYKALIDDATANTESLIVTALTDPLQPFSYGAPSHVSDVVVLNSMLTGLHAIAPSASLSASTIESIAAFALEQRFSRDANDVFAVISILHFVESLKQPPLAVTAVTPSAKADASTSPLHVRLTTPLDKPVTNEKLHVTVYDAHDKAVVQDATLSHSSNGVYEESSKWKSLSPAVYALDVTRQAEAKGHPARLFATKYSKLDGITAVLSITESAKDDGKSGKTVSHPATIDEHLSGDASDFIHIKVTTKADAPLEQVSVVISRAASANTAVFPTKYADASKAHIVKINLGALDVMESLGGAGDFDIRIVVGDELLNAAVDWRVASIALTLPTLSGDRFEWSSALPSIAHTFRPADSRPNILIALFFTALVMLPVAALIFALFTYGPPITLPSSPEEMFYAGLFQLSLLAIITLYVLYWLSLNIFQAGVGLLVLGILALLTGNAALTRLHIRKSVAKRKVE